MIITWSEQEYEYDPKAIDVQTAIKIREHTGMGMRSWEKAIDDADPIALQALLWAMLKQAGENRPIRTLNFSPVEFYEAVVEASLRELAERAAQAEAAGDDPEADPTPAS